MEFTDIIYQEADGVATITINRPKVYNAFNANTVEELIKAFGLAGWNKDIGVVVLTGAGDKAFCTGGDQSGDGYNGRGTVGLPIEELQSIIRDIPKPVIARVNGYAIGGGNVLVTICDLAIASETAIFGQVGPKVGSVDPGFGTAYLARIIGEKRAREVWYMCRRYSAKEALDAETKKWCDEILEKSPTAIALAKRSFNIDTENIRGIGAFAMQALALYYDTDESKEGGNAFREKRKPEFRKYVK